MKKALYILLTISLIACKHNQETLSKSVEEVPTSINNDQGFNFAVKPMSQEQISSQKLEEYIDLIKLKRKHPEFEKDINDQLISFTNDSLSIGNYPKGFSISNIEQLGDSKVISNSVEQMVLGFTVTTNAMTFKDSILTEIRSKAIVIDGDSLMSNNVRFLKF